MGDIFAWGFQQIHDTVLALTPSSDLLVKFPEYFSMIVFTAAHFLTTVSESEILYYADENINSGLPFTVRLLRNTRNTDVSKI